MITYDEAEFKRVSGNERGKKETARASVQFGNMAS